MLQTLVCGVSLTFEVGPHPGTKLCKALLCISWPPPLPASLGGSSFSLTPRDSGGSMVADVFSQGRPLPVL